MKRLARSKCSCFHTGRISEEDKSFVTFTPVANVIKLRLLASKLECLFALLSLLFRLGRLHALLGNVRRVCKGLPGANSLAFFTCIISDEEKSLVLLMPALQMTTGVNFIKLFCCNLRL
jgi:hypothetical protein